MTITLQQLQEARSQALDQIRQATRRKNAARDALNPGATAVAAGQSTQQEQDHRIQAYRTAYDDWRSTLINEHARQLLRPLEIYRAAAITKQMFSKLRAQAQNNQPAAYTLPPDGATA